MTLSAADATSPTQNLNGGLLVQGSVTGTTGAVLNAGLNGITISGALASGSGSLTIGTIGLLTDLGTGAVTTGMLQGAAGSVSLTSRANHVTGVANANSGFLVTSATGDFTLAAGATTLTVGASTSGGLSVQTGRTITLAADGLTIGANGSTASIAAPMGTIALTPFTTTNGILLTAGTATPANTLVVTTAALGNTTASTLQLGAAVGTAGPPTGTVNIGYQAESFDLGPAGYNNVGPTTLALQTAGAVTQLMTADIAVGTITGQAGSLSILGENNFIANFAGFSTSSGDLSFHTGIGLTVTGAVIANGGAGNVTLSSAGSFTTLPNGLPVAMVLAGSISGNQVSIDSLNGAPSMSGGINQTGGTITATSLVGSGNFALLTNANQIQQLGGFTTYGALTVTTTTPLSVTGAVVSTNGAVTLNAAGIMQTAGSSISATEFDGSSSASTVLANTANAIPSIGSFSQSAGDFTLATSSPSLLFGGGTSGVVSASTGSLTFLANQVGLAGSPVGGISAPSGTVIFAPVTTNQPIELIGASAAAANTLSLSQAFVNRISATTLQLGTAGTSGAINIGNAGETVTLAGHVGTLGLVTSGAVTEGNTGTAALVVGTLTGNTGAVTMTGGNQIATLGAYQSGGAFTLNDTVPLAITGPVASPTLVQAVTSAAMTVSGNVTAPTITLGASGGTVTQTAGTIAATGTLTLNSSGLTSQSGGSITAGTLTGTTGSLSLTQAANAIQTISGAASGTVSLLNSTGLTIGTGTAFGNTTLSLSAGNISFAGAASFGNLAVSLPGSATTAPGATLTAGIFSGSAASVNIAGGRLTTLGRSRPPAITASPIRSRFPSPG